MFTALITWVVFGGSNTMSVEIVHTETCATMRAEAVTRPMVKAAACVTSPDMVVEALKLGECTLFDGPRDDLRPYYVYVCNGRLPKWK